MSPHQPSAGDVRPVGARRLTASVGVLKFLILLGLAPAIMTSLIAPRFWYARFIECWGACVPVRIVEPMLGGVPVYSAVAGCALALGLALALWGKSYRNALSLTPLLLFLLRGTIDGAADAVLATPDGYTHYYVGELLYNISCSVIFICFIFLPRRFVRTAFFAAFLVFLSVMIFVEPHFGAGELIFYLGSVLAARIVVRFAAHNLDLFGRLGVARTLMLLGRSLVLMVPILALIGLGEWMRVSFESALSDVVYAKAPLCAAQARLDATRDLSSDSKTEAKALAAGLAGLGPPSCPPPNLESAERDAMLSEARTKYVAMRAELRDGDSCAALRRDAPAGERHLERDLCYYAEYLHAGRSAALKSKLLDTKGDVSLNAARLRQNAKDLSNEVVPQVRIPRPASCPEFPWLLCELERAVLYVAEEGINGALSRVRGGIVSGANTLVGEGVALSDEAIDKLEAQVDEGVAQLRLATRATLANGFDLVGVIDHGLLVLLVLAFLKSLLFIFARVAFSSVDKESSIAFAEPGEAIPEGTVEVRGKRYTLEGRGRVFYSRRAQVEGIAPRIWLPQPLACVLSRVLAGNYLMNCANCENAAEGRIVFKTAGVRELVEWRLAPGEEVIFHLNDFVAMDASVRISSYVSFRIPTLLMGRFIFRVARGPGRLILRTAGTAEVSETGDAALSKPVHRFVAWHRAARFKLEAEQGFADIYLSGVHVKKSPGDLVVFVAEAADRPRIGTGAVRFLKTFILPI
ncbi:MAG: hypothetical protein PVG24_04005 [Gammaproteobacteria bacterium]|jgi:uncharacterized protein (AIM24 family)